MPLEIFIALIAAGSMAVAILSVLILRLTLTRRLKKELKASGDYWNSGTLDFGFLNTFVFAWACTLPFVPRSDNFKAIYNDLDVKAFATVFERGTAYVMASGYAVFFLSAPLYYLIKA